jgi:DNA-binding MarR family transcriptional regulator
MHASVASAQPNDRELDTLVERVAAALAVIHREGSQEFMRAVAELDLSFSQVKALHFLDDGDDQAAMCVKDVADRLGLSLGATSRAVESMHHRGLVERREDGTDRRMRRVRLTAAGRDAVGRIHQARLAGVRQVVGDLSPDERAELSRAIAPLADRKASRT